MRYWYKWTRRRRESSQISVCHAIPVYPVRVAPVYALPGPTVRHLFTLQAIAVIAVSCVPLHAHIVIPGRVVDETGAAVSGARVSIQNAAAASAAINAASSD